MLYSTDILKNEIRKYVFDNIDNKDIPDESEQFFKGVLDAMQRVIRIIEDSENKNSQIEKPAIILAENENAVVLYCDKELWEYILEIKNQQLEKITLPDIAKIWLKLKKILKNQTSTTVKEI